MSSGVGVGGFVRFRLLPRKEVTRLWFVESVVTLIYCELRDKVSPRNLRKKGSNSLTKNPGKIEINRSNKFQPICFIALKT